MAIYHCSIKIISRGKGKSAVAAAAYRSGEKLINDYDGVTHDYTRKSGISHTEILLPAHAPHKFSDRSTIWNAVEKIEKAKNSQFARELVVALPVELKSDEWIEMLRDFISENCVSKGMCADFSIHDTDGHNPHAHILLTMRPLDDNGKWQAKTQKEYLCKCGGVSERCELNRQIRKDNVLLRQLKALVKSLTEAAKEAVSVIAEKLEKYREKAIFSLYECKHNEKLSADIQRNNTVTDLLLSRFNSVKKQISQKSSKAKKLQAEKNGLSAVNVFKCRQLSEQIENLQTEVNELKTEKAVLLSDMKCETEEDLPNIKKQREQNDVSLKNMSTRNSQLAEQMKANIDDFKATIADISPEDMPAVQEERSNFRSTMKSLWTKIQQQYGYRSNYDLLKATKDEIDMELGEYQPHIRKSIRRDLEQKRWQADEQQSRRNRRDEWER